MRSPVDGLLAEKPVRPKGPLLHLSLGPILLLAACSGGDSGTTGASGIAGATGGSNGVSASSAGGITNGGGGNAGPTSAGASGSAGTASDGATGSGTASTGGTGNSDSVSGDSGGSSSGSGATTGRTSGGTSNTGAGDTGGPVDAGRADARGSTGARDAGSDARVTVDASAPNDAGRGVLPFKGIANSDCNDLTTLKVSWWYNWEQTPKGCQVQEFVPMVWGHTGNEQSATGIANALTQFVDAGYQYVLGFNEPDNSGQSNISVDAAIALWPAFKNPALKVGSPATQANTSGMTWFKSFMSQVNADTTGTLKVDFIAVHWYGWNSGSCEANASTMESYIKQIEAIPGNRPLWITEWGCLNMSNPDAATVQKFFSGAVAMFAKHPRIERYAWYPWTTNNELVANGALTSLGTAFSNEPTYR